MVRETAPDLVTGTTAGDAGPTAFPRAPARRPRVVLVDVLETMLRVDALSNRFVDVGRPAEELNAALARLVAEFEATDRLVRLAERATADTLDGIDLTGVPAPPMAVNLLDFECLARSVPGTRVAL